MHPDVMIASFCTTLGAGGKNGSAGQAAKGGGANDVFLVTSAEGKLQLIQVIAPDPGNCN